MQNAPAIMPPKRGSRVKIKARVRMRLAILLCLLSLPFAFGGIELASTANTKLRILVEAVFISPTIITGLLAVAFRVWEQPQDTLAIGPRPPVIYSK